MIKIQAPDRPADVGEDESVITSAHVCTPHKI
jgi:hypothetical protein